MNPYVALGLAVLLAVSHGWAYVTGGKHKENEYKAEQLVAVEQARETEKKWQEAVNEANRKWQSKNAATQRSLDVALNSLRDRPERPLPGAAETKCAGATGAELFRSDGEFLAREAARGDRFRSALEACYTVIDGVK